MNSEVSFQTAFEQHEAGNLDEAEHIYREILQQEPGNADVLHLLGVLLFQKKDYDAALVGGMHQAGRRTTPAKRHAQGVQG